MSIETMSAILTIMFAFLMAMGFTIIFDNFCETVKKYKEMKRRG